MKSKAVITIATAALLMVAISDHSTLAAGPGARSDAALGKIVRGRTITFKAGLGVEVPISYRPDGTMVGHVRAWAAALPGNGPRSDRGKWWISKGSLCQRWRHWLDGKRHCYRLSQRGRIVHWRRDDGRNGTARLTR